MNPLRVLLIDDNVQAAETLGVILRYWGYEVRVAFGGPAGLDAAADFLPGLILLDINMPEMNGFDVVREVRRRPELAGLTVISLTGDDIPASLRPRGAGGFDHHLSKPLNLDALERLLAREARRAELGARAAGP